jgi:hypothetical protein
MSSYAVRYRLEAAKRRAAENAARFVGPSSAHLSGPYSHDWRVVARANAKRRFSRPAVWNPAYTDDNGRAWRWLETVEGSGLRVVVENATEAANGRGRVTGYYVDTHATDAQHGAVLATRDPESPRARFFAAISDPYNDGAYCILWESHGDMDSAVRAADSLAERAAEESRAYDAAFQAGARYSDLGEEIKASRAKALVILQDRKTARGSATLCAVIREKVDSLVTAIAEARAVRERLANGEGESSDDWARAFWTGDKRLQAAFADGAGLAGFPA